MTSRFLSTLAAALGLACASCDRSSDVISAEAKAAAAKRDMPLLPTVPGDRWTYQVDLWIPAGVTSSGSAEVENRYERVRTYLGKISPAKGLPVVDAFEITVPGFPVEREFVEIRPDAILMRGSIILREETTLPMWLDQPVPFVTAGLAAGDKLPDVVAPEGGLSRETRVVGREDITVPAGSFSCIRLLTTGMDGEIELRRSVWFSPGSGIIREEKTRYRDGQVIFREDQQLTGLEMGVEKR